MSAVEVNINEGGGHHHHHEQNRGGNGSYSDHFHRHMHDHKSGGKLLLIVSVILVALTAQQFRIDFFGMSRPIDLDDLSVAKSFCGNITDECEIQAKSSGSAFQSCVAFDSTQYVAGGTCECRFKPANEGATCAPNYVCHIGACIPESGADPCLGVTDCNTPPTDCMLASSGRCVNGQCQWEADPARENQLCGVDNVWIGQRCGAGQCQNKTLREVTAYNYEASISSAVISGALGIELAMFGVGTPTLAAFAINFGLINMGWAGYSSDVGRWPTNTALHRTQNAFCFLLGGLTVLIGLRVLLAKRAKAGALFAILGILGIGFSVVQFGLAAELFNEHFTHTANGEIDTNSNIVFNWSYNATIFSAAVNLAVSITLLVTGTCCSGFVMFEIFAAMVALAWATKQQDYGHVPGQPTWTKTFHAFESLVVISAAYFLIVGLILFVKGEKRPNTAVHHKGLSVAGLLTACTTVGLVAGLFAYQFFKNGYQDINGDNMNLVQPNVNYGNLVSPFAWPVSIWTSIICGAFTFTLLLKGAPTTGISALVFTESANLLGWAAAHTFYGPAVAPTRFQPNTNGWAGVALTTAVIFLICSHSCLHDATVADQKQEDTQPRATEEAPQADEFQNPQKN